MDSTSSVSKGVFVFKNNFNARVKPIAKKDIRKNRNKSKLEEDEPFQNIYSSQLWYQSYNDLWKILERKIKKLNNDIFSKIMFNLLLYVRECYKKNVTEIPTATILMGINMPDHATQFETLSDQIKFEISPHVALLHAEDSSNIKSLIENMVSQFVNDEDANSDDSDSELTGNTIKRSLCTISLLTSWYNKKYMSISSHRKNTNKRQKPDSEKKNLVVVIPEFESFEELVLRDFILIISSYLNVLPFVLIFGVATSLTTVHKMLPYQVSSKLNIQVFSSQSSTEYLNCILNNILLNETCPFHLGGRTFSLFSDIFLFYDFSVKGFIQNFKFAMLDHYSYGNAMSLCTKVENIDNILSKFTHEDFENTRRLLSFRNFVESKNYEIRIKLLTDDKYFKSELRNCIVEFHEYIYCFHALLRCLHQLVADLPGSPLGKQFREIYAISVSENITKTDEFKQCMQILHFLSKDELVTKINNLYTTIKQYVHKETNDTLNNILSIFTTLKNNLDDPDFKIEDSQQEVKVLTENMNRVKLKEELLKMSKETKPQSTYEKLRENILQIIIDIFKNNLTLPTLKPFHEIFFFNNANSIKSHIVGSHRAAIHMALNNPQCYIQCECCKLPNEMTILPTLPDVCIVYKLHLECGKFINMYDWLQAFITIVDPTDEDREERNVDPKLQARFTRAVAELEFLGFIKSSKRKTDHVQRLTWGGC